LSGPQDAGAARFYLPELDLIRFLACTAIFLQHAFQRTPAHEFPEFHPDLIGRIVAILGWSGGYSVDLFFMLSAFLITQLLMREQDATGRLDLRRFYMRRILRVWPLYFGFLAIMVVAGIWSKTFRIPPRFLILTALLSANIANGLWGWTPTFAISHLWTISVEEHFYLFWPLIVRRCRARGLVKVALAMLAISFTARTICWMVNAPGSVVWTNTLTRLDPLAVGIILAVWMRKNPFRPRAGLRLPLLLLGLATMLTVSAWCDPFWSPNSTLTIFFGYPAIALGCVPIILAFSGLPLNQDHLLPRAGIYLGRISYGLYIWQMTGLELAIQALNRPLPFAPDWVYSSRFTTMLAFGLTIAMAATSYHLLERPFLRLKTRFAVIPSRPA
jgi:peptidoglycan/LPS O-acetylase OafA/YrhL